MRSYGCRRAPPSLVRAAARQALTPRMLAAQYVSSTPATRLDVINLQERLDQQLQQRQAPCPACPRAAHILACSGLPGAQARETGICPVREELYAQCFGATSPVCSTLQPPA